MSDFSTCSSVTKTLFDIKLHVKLPEKSSQRKEARERVRNELRLCNQAESVTAVSTFSRSASCSLSTLLPLSLQKSCFVWQCSPFLSQCEAFHCTASTVLSFGETFHIKIFRIQGFLRKTKSSLSLCSVLYPGWLGVHADTCAPTFKPSCCYVTAPPHVCSSHPGHNGESPLHFCVFSLHMQLQHCLCLFIHHHISSSLLKLV